MRYTLEQGVKIHCFCHKVRDKTEKSSRNVEGTTNVKISSLISKQV